MNPSSCSIHSTLITGGEQIDRLEYAQNLAQKLLCIEKHELPCNHCVNCSRILSHTHPNLIFIEPPLTGDDEHSSDAAFIKIEQVRRVISESHKQSFEPGATIFIITHMHKLTKAASNALLKVIEESSSTKLFLALAPSRMTVLPTIASRLVCQLVKPKKRELPMLKDTQALVMKICETQPYSRFALLAHFSTERDKLLNEISDFSLTCQDLLHARLIAARGALQILEALHKAELSLKKNLNPRLVTENLLFKEWPLMTCAVSK